MDSQTRISNPWNPISEVRSFPAILLPITNPINPQDTVVSALKLILDPKNYPLSVMCNLGRHRTGEPPPPQKKTHHLQPFRSDALSFLEGTVIGCLRKIQRWNLTSIFEEYRRHAGSKVFSCSWQFAARHRHDHGLIFPLHSTTQVRLLNEQFIELFDTDLVGIPENPPHWL